MHRRPLSVTKSYLSFPAVNITKMKHDKARRHNLAKEEGLLVVDERDSPAACFEGVRCPGLHSVMILSCGHKHQPHYAWLLSMRL